MNKRQKEVQKIQLQKEQVILRLLQNIYKQASEDCAERIRGLNAREDMQNLQSIIYQERYQTALKKQIDGILDGLQGKQYESIADYLQQCYEDGYTGVMYDLQGQGIPVMAPIDQAQVVKAIQVDSKLSKPMYDRLGEDVDQLKRSVRLELSRGTAQGKSWLDIADELAKGMNSPFKKARSNAQRIARTEGHRIAMASQNDAMERAKETGADVVKQWNAALDSKTRKSHRRLDGQIRELDDYFEINGHKARYPGDFGRPEEDINCRCTVEQRARWALDENELQRLKDRAAYFKLDKTEDFEDFKKKFNVIDSDDLMAPTGTGTGDGEADGKTKTYKDIRLSDLREKSEEWTREEDIKAVNPGKNKGKGRMLNCQRCVPAYELRMRGYDVIAEEANVDSEGRVVFDDAFKRASNIFIGFKYKSAGSGNGKRFIEKRLLEYGEGARVQIHIQWSGKKREINVDGKTVEISSQHTFIAENINGEIHFIDPQSGLLDCSEYFTEVQNSCTMYERIDQLDIDEDYLKYCVRNRGGN